MTSTWIMNGVVADTVLWQIKLPDVWLTILFYILFNMATLVSSLFPRLNPIMKEIRLKKERRKKNPGWSMQVRWHQRPHSLKRRPLKRDNNPKKRKKDEKSASRVLSNPPETRQKKKKKLTEDILLREPSEAPDVGREFEAVAAELD